MPNSQLDEIRMVDPVLTTISQGYQNDTFVTEKLFPTVEVSKLKGKIPSFGKEAFVVRDLDRADGAASNRISQNDITMLEFTTTERDVEIAIDYLAEEEAEDYGRYETNITKQLSDSLQLQKEKAAADFVQDPVNYDPSLTRSILLAEAFDDYTSPTDPIDVIKDAMSSVRAKIAHMPNTMVMGEQTYRALSSHPLILDRIKHSGLGKVTVEILQDLLDIKNIYVGMAVYTTDGTTFSDVWADNIVLAYVDKSTKDKRSEFNPSFGYTFQREGRPEIDSYYENGGKVKVIRATDNYVVQVTGKDAAFLITNTNQY